MRPQFPGGFAVLMAVYGKDDPLLFHRALQSVLDNSLLPNEIWVVVDGIVTIELNAVLAEFESACPQEMLHILRLKENKGLAHALNIGLAAISLPWIVRADADDVNLPQRFESQAALLQKMSYLDLQSSAILEVTNSGEAIAIRSVPETEQEILRFASSRNPFNHMAAAFRREKVVSVGGYPPVHLREDYALWCKMLAAGARVANSSEVLVHATAGMEMYRRRGGWKYARAEWAMQRILVKCGLKGVWRATVDSGLRSIVFLVPSVVRGWIYKRLLRTRLSRSSKQ